MTFWPLVSICGQSSHRPTRDGGGMLTQTEIDANGLQGGKGEQPDPKGHEPVCKGSQGENG